MLEQAQKSLEETMDKKKSFFTPKGFLQFFADEGGTGEGSGGSGEGAGEGSGGGEGSGEGETGGTGGEGNKGGSGDSGSGKSKSFTQDDVNAIAAKEAKKATEKILKQLGVTDFKTAKDGLDKFKEIQESQKTDAQKALEKAQALEGTNTDLTNQVTLLNAQLAALKADVNPDSLSDVIVLANNLVSDDKTIDDAIKEVLTKYPHFKKDAAGSNAGDGKKPPKFTEGKHEGGTKPNEQDSWNNAFNFTGKN